MIRASTLEPNNFYVSDNKNKLISYRNRGKNKKQEEDDDWDALPPLPPPGEEGAAQIDPLMESPADQRKSNGPALTWAETWEMVKEEFNAMFIYSEGIPPPKKVSRDARKSSMSVDEGGGAGTDDDGPSWLSKMYTKVVSAKDPMGNPLIKAFAPLVVIFLWNNVPLPEEIRVIFARIIFAINITTQLVLFVFIIKPRIEKKIDDGDMEARVEVKEQVWGEGGAMTETTDYISAGEYDMSKVWAHLKQVGIQVPIALFVHWKFEYTVPLVVQSTVAYFNVSTNPLYEMYVTGKEDVVALKRPFAADSNNFWANYTKMQQAANGEKPVAENKQLSTKSLVKQAKAREAEMKKAR